MKGTDSYNDWWQTFNTFLILGDLTDVTTRLKPRPGDDLPGEQSRWDRKYDVAKACIFEKVCFNARMLVEKIESPAAMLDKLHEFYRPRGITTYASLCWGLEELHLSKYDTVEEYTEAFNRINNEMERLRPLATLPEIYKVQKYLLGLGERFDTFLAAFNQSRTFEFDEGRSATNTSLEEIVRAVAAEAQRMNLKADNPAFMVKKMSSKGPVKENITPVGRPKNNRAVVELDYYTHCDKHYHTAENCFKLHPELKKKKGKGGSPQKRRKNSDNDIVEYSGNGAPTYMALAPEKMTAFMTMGEDINLALTDAHAFKKAWFLNSAAGRYYCNDKDSFIMLHQVNAGTVRGFKGALQCLGIGDVEVYCRTNWGIVRHVFKNVVYCLNAPANLLCIRNLLLTPGVDARVTKDIFVFRNENTEIRGFP